MRVNIYSDEGKYLFTSSMTKRLQQMRDTTGTMIQPRLFTFGLGNSLV